MHVFRLTMFPAGEGDCLLLSYGKRGGLLDHVLVDGGTAQTWRHLRPFMSAIISKGERLRLMVLSHIDADHLNGLIKMVEDKSAPKPEEIWYNGYPQLKLLDEQDNYGPLGFDAADRYTDLLSQAGWVPNAAFGGRPLHIDQGPREISLGELKLTILSPDRTKLRALFDQWQRWRSGMDDSETTDRWGPLGEVVEADEPSSHRLDIEALSRAHRTDPSVPNGSSIAFLAEYGGKRVLLAADAHTDLLEEGLIQLAQAHGGPFPVDLFKLSHHGSQANISKRLLSLMACSRFAVSTNGARFRHPDAEAIAKVITARPAEPKRLVFNYRSAFTTLWESSELQARWNYTCTFPEASFEPMMIDI